MIEGKRNFFKVPVRGAVGVVTVDGEQLIACGPSRAIEKHSRVVVEVVPGEMKKSELAREARTRLKTASVDVSIEEVERALPPGKGDFKRTAGE